MTQGVEVVVTSLLEGGAGKLPSSHSASSPACSARCHSGSNSSGWQELSPPYPEHRNSRHLVRTITRVWCFACTADSDFTAS